MGGLKAECTQVTPQDVSLLPSFQSKPRSLSFLVLPLFAQRTVVLDFFEGALVGFTCLLGLTLSLEPAV